MAPSGGRYAPTICGDIAGKPSNFVVQREDASWRHPPVWPGVLWRTLLATPKGILVADRQIFSRDAPPARSRGSPTTCSRSDRYGTLAPGAPELLADAVAGVDAAAGRYEAADAAGV